MAAEAPYCVPVQLDLHLVESLLVARASAAEDHIWALREDPDYFSRTLLDDQALLLEGLKDVESSCRPQSSRLWSKTISRDVHGASLELEVFPELNRQAKRLAAMREKYADDISPSKGLTDEYLEAFLRFKYHAKSATGDTVTKLFPQPLQGLCTRGVAS